MDEPCPSAATLAAYGDGKLGPAERREVEKHIAACEDCFELFAGAAAFRLEEAADHQSVSKLPRPDPVRWWVPAVAAAVLAAGLWVAREETTERSEMVASADRVASPAEPAPTHSEITAPPASPAPTPISRMPERPGLNGGRRSVDGHAPARPSPPRSPGETPAASSALAFAGRPEAPAALARLPAAGSASDRGIWWITTYGPVDPAKDPRAGFAQEVFERMAAAVDKRSDRLPRLLLVGAAGSPYAVALPDGSVVLTRGALDFCYGKPSGPQPGRERGDLRLAFVLGHELAHLSGDDFWHRSAFAAAEQFPAASDARSQELRALLRAQPRDLQRAEAEADGDAAITMAMAGYSPAELLRGDPDFFARWVSQPGLEPAYADPAHPSPEQRADLVRSQLMALVENLDLFHFGVRLAQLGRYSGAIQLLERFRDHFAGREVLTDLGYAYYQLAMKALAACDGAPTMRFRLPVAIDDETLAARARLRGGSSTCLESESVRKQVEEARRNLDLAIDKDPRYLPARHNLLAVELVAGSAATAIQDAEDTLEVAPGDTAALLAKAVGIYRVGVEFNMDGMQEAEKLLQEAEADPRREADAVYAHAVMLTEQSRFANAQAEWERFLRLEPHGDYADYARERLGRLAEPPPPAASAPGPPIPLGVVTAETMATLASYEQWPFDLGVAYRGKGLRILQLGDAIEVVEQAVSPTHPAPSPPQGAIPVRVETPRGVFLRYPGVGFDMEGDRVRSVVYFAPAR